MKYLSIVLFGLMVSIPAFGANPKVDKEESCWILAEKECTKSDELLDNFCNGAVYDSCMETPSEVTAGRTEGSQDS